MFNVNDYVFYGTVGVCRIESISELDFGEKGKLYYVIKPLDSKSGTIYSLVDSDKVRMRNIISKEKASELLDTIDNIEAVVLSDRKLQAVEYKDIEKSANYEKWMGMLKGAYAKRQKKISEGKKLLTSEEQMLKDAESLLLQEFALALSVSAEEVKECILKKIEEVDT